MNKITPDHLTRSAYVYIRQSTPDQVHRNQESRRRQYGLPDRARQLGWTDVVLVDDDLGVSGSGVSRPGFERLLVAVCEGRVGAVLSIEASRLARNGRDWHTLLEFCAFVGCLIVDEDGVYDPRLPNDRLLLGMKGTFSELELAVFRQRSQEAIKLKAQRGELFKTVAVGYWKAAHDRIEKEPDRRVQQAIILVFRKFAELQSIRQVHRWLRRESITLPSIVYEAVGRRIVWKPPVYQTVHGILTNPVYAGAYAYGRTTQRIRIEDGRKRVVRGCPVARQDWSVLIPDHHEGYVSWHEYERNQELIANNAGNKGLMVRRAVRPGATLLNGLLRCGRCGRKLHVAYSGRGSVRYYCRAAYVNHSAEQCISFGALRVDQAVSQQVLHRLQPLGVTAALKALETHDEVADDRRTQVELALKQARYEANRAERQYDAVEPEHRNIAAELERRWNERLNVVQELEARLAQLASERPPPIDRQERSRFLALGADLERAWNHPAACVETRKRILRTVLVEIVASVADNEIDLMLHWQGGDHTNLKVIKARSGEHRWKLDAATSDIIMELARLMPDMHIASVLNRAGKRTGRDNTWTEPRVRAFRNDHDIPVYRPGERAERGEITPLEAAEKLGISEMAVRRLIAKGALNARQACKGAPWVIKAETLVEVKLRRYRPVTQISTQRFLEF
jgi:DNA invertase Pin-like site-specific DNA recombinase